MSQATFGMGAHVEEEIKLRQREQKYKLVGTAAYLLGVERRCLNEEEYPEEVHAYDDCEKDKAARILHYLTMARASIIRNFGTIYAAIRQDYLTVYSADDTVRECVTALTHEGLDIFTRGTDSLLDNLVELNKLIRDRVNNCKNLFPDWLNWEYVRDLFLMPGGTEKNAVEACSKAFRDERMKYPYQTWLNWTFPAEEDQGNILSSDGRFTRLLYEMHNDSFEDESKVMDVGADVKREIYQFLYDAGKCAVLVDCENSDPYHLCATLKNLDSMYLSKISKIILIDDVNTSSAWDIFDRYVEIPIEHKELYRLKDEKSLVDMTLAVTACREHYENGVDSVIIASSDSDYWALISSMPNLSWLVMAEREKTGPDIKEALTQVGITYCYIDDFYDGSMDGLMKSAVLKELRTGLESSLSNLKSQLTAACRRACARLSDEEFGSLYTKVAKSVRLEISDTGEMNVVLDMKTPV